MKIALGIVLGSILLTYLDSILVVALILVGLATVLGLTGGAVFWLWSHPEDMALLVAIVFFIILCVKWEDWMTWLRQKIIGCGQLLGKSKKEIQVNGLRKTLLASTTEREKNRRKKMGYDE